MSDEISKTQLEALRKRAGTQVFAQGWAEISRLPWPRGGFVKNGQVKDFTCAQIGKALSRHPDTIYRWFKDVPGVIKKQHPAKRMKDPKTGEWKIKRKHTILLIPPHVFTKWLREHTKHRAFFNEITRIRVRNRNKRGSIRVRTRRKNGGK